MVMRMKTIAIIESCDTKYKEAKFIKDFIEKEGVEGLVINTATGPAKYFQRRSGRIIRYPMV